MLTNKVFVGLEGILSDFSQEGFILSNEIHLIRQSFVRGARRG